MECPRCRAELPEVAHFCQTCGLDLRTPDQARRRSFAARPDEPVASFALISTIMPRGAGQRPQTYRIALVIALTVALIAAIFGALPIAVLVAAFAVPIVYIVYLYDVNLWEDEPVPVTGAAFVLTGVLALAFTLIWTQFADPGLHVADLGGAAESGPRVGTFLLVAVLVPIVGEAIRQLGPCFLASRPRFDDLMDGLTFGVISGVAYATFDTLVRHGDQLFGGLAGTSDPGFWVTLIFLEGLVKPLIMGTATGIACAEFSGLGRGYDGFSLRYARGVAEAVVANIAFAAGSYLFSFLTPSLGVLLNLGWGLLILAVLILRVRVVLHTGLMEAALERSARDRGVGEDGELDFCAHCEMPLLAGAAFCNACGTAVRARAKRPVPRTPAGVGAESAPGPVTGAVPTGPGSAGDALSPSTEAPAWTDYPPPERSQPTPLSRPRDAGGTEGQAGDPPARSGDDPWGDR
ncbi:hypothetical protein FHX74_001902 [Friedmanniella endophytica]|uniref:Membrane proteinase PrsW, cleaves anti-sigma factor RsiW, M82 family n=1 Tax=Microlunatus kandeliicorticis TaxID=1759536 RepID=A0A7W3ISA6_9ACTN|nr:PrsW family glutamic-type intramembrane protease [Microlunatus kandeliicorticis]MBA8794283.1 hypothetical protein [Microlunatus kandeliicorticis]